MALIKKFTIDSLNVKVFDTRLALGREAARETGSKIKELLQYNADINMIFAAAPSQNEFLEALSGDTSIIWNRINAFHMDEYIGLEADTPQRFASFLHEKIFARVAFKSINYLDGNTEDILAECRRYSGLLQRYPPHIVCMGIGENGHIAFNDPHEANFHDPDLVKVVELDEKCRMQQVHDGCFNHIDAVPMRAITLTIPALMAGKFIYCAVPAATKAEAVFSVVTSEISEACPASILRNHSNATLFLDLDSGKKLL